MAEHNWQEFYEMQSIGDSGTFGIKILVQTDHSITGEERRLAASATDTLMGAIQGTSLRASKAEQARVLAERRDLLACFAEPIYVEEIPNGYCDQWCCKHRPWYVVTTRVGRITIGWRKRVIQISWEAAVADLAEKVFADATGTKADRLIHAWGYAEAKQIVGMLTRGNVRSVDTEALG
jgi:hypothetical protein